MDKEKGFLISRVVPALIFISLWLDGWLLPLILLPFLYVIFVEGKDLKWLGFRKEKIRFSVHLGLLASVFLMAVYYPISLLYAPSAEKRASSLYDVFTDVIWYPLYEEAAYRSFLLAHFASFDESSLSRRNILVNLVQSISFLSIHKHHVFSGMLAVLAPVFLLALLNGFLFLKTRNISGCLLSHSAVNGFALLLRYIV